MTNFTNKTHYIDGHWNSGEPSSTLIISENPATGNEIWQGRAAEQITVNAAVQSARNAFSKWALTPLSKRIAIMESYQSILKTHQRELAQCISDETGKQYWEASTEAATMVAKIGLSLSAYDQRTGTTQKDLNGITASLTHRPHGVLLVLGPYNFPGHLPNGHIVPALLAGNSLVFKPSEITPMVGQQLVEYLIEAGVPDGVINLVQGDSNTGALLSSHDDIDGLLFTGSSNTGAALHKQFGGQPGKLLALEMGGNNPLIYDHVSDIKAAVYQTIQSAYITSGQRCTCARRLIVVRSENGKQFVQELQHAIQNINVGLPDAGNAFYGPLVTNQAADSLLNAQQLLLDSGATALVKMRRLNEKRPLLSPGLIDSSAVAERPDEEYFGPMLQLIWVDNLEDAIAEANNTRFGLAGGMLTDSDDAWQQYYINARAGILNRNRPTTGASGSAPFGGIGASGNHRPSAYYAADYCAYPMASMSDPKPVLPTSLSPGITL